MSRRQSKMTGKMTGKMKKKYFPLQEGRFQEIYVQDVLIPEKLQGKLQIISCLSHREEQQVYLTKNENGRKSILKVAQKNQIPFLEKEAEYLKSAQFSFIPKYLDAGKEETGYWLLKEYIEGDTLWERVERQGPFMQAEADALILRICTMIGRFHKSEPPIIHRDIKPQNIVLTEEGNLFLIDMGTARTFRSEASHDTIFVGTRLSAAPEQYGYRQTDARTDIYALGVLYLYLLTGNMKLQTVEFAAQISSKRRKIVEICTRMEPEERYQSCTQLSTAVLAAGDGKGNLRKKYRKYGITMLTVLGLIGGVCFVHYTSERAPYQFREEMIEEAVRNQLGKGDTEFVSKQELRKIEVLRICGNTILEAGDQHRQYCGHHYINGMEQAEITGTVQDLSDLSYMKNLRELILDGQQITDIAALKKLPLERVSLCDNPLKNCAVFSNIGTLKQLELDHTDLDTLKPITNLKELEHLDIGDTRVKRLEPLSEVESLRTLMMAGISVIDIEMLEKMPLETLVLHSNVTGTEAAAGKITGLKDLTIYNYHDSNLQPLLELNNLVSLTVYGGTLHTLEGIEKFPLLERLNIGWTLVTDLTPVRQLERMRELWIEEVDADDYTPILELRLLKQLGCSSWQTQEIRELTDEPWFEIVETE